MTQNKTFRQGTLVWAMLEDSVQWPGRVAHQVFTEYFRNRENKKTGLAILFFGTALSYALVEESNLSEFDASSVSRIIQNCVDNSEELKIAVEMVLNSTEIIDPPYISTLRTY